MVSTNEKIKAELIEEDRIVYIEVRL